MSRDQQKALRRYAKALAKLGVPFEVAAILIANKMRDDGIPISLENLDRAFSL
ncbi:hypothetical protein [Tabrizicola sp. M-4]|uniref:hypothetical protein n=1 Tax=Tabrizicola sp. M-4 TaxID=3055847 RepID=UPI003DA8E4B5